MSEEKFQNMKKNLQSIQDDIDRKITQLEENIDRITSEHQSYMTKYTKEFDKELGWDPYLRIAQLQHELQLEKERNNELLNVSQNMISKKKEIEQEGVSITVPSNISPVTAEFISKKFEEHSNLILHFFKIFSKGFKNLAEFENLSDEERKYITDSNLQTIGERLTVSLQNEELNKEVYQLKNKLSTFQLDRDNTFQQLEEYKRQIDYKGQEIDILKIMIAEKNDECEQLQSEKKKIVQELEDIKNQFMDMEQAKLIQNIKIEKDELHAKVLFDEETNYKKELTELKDVLNKRKIEIKTLKKENAELRDSIELKREKKTIIEEEKSISDISKSPMESFEEVFKQRQQLKQSLSKLEDQYARFQDQLTKLFREGKNLGLIGTEDVQSQLQELQLYIHLSSALYAKKGHIQIFRFLRDNHGWKTRQEIAKKTGINAGIIRGALIELHGANLVEYDEETDKAKLKIFISH